MMNNMTDTVKQLLIINVLFFIGSYLVPQSQELLVMHYFESEGFKVWQPITRIFMHLSLGHIFFNMIALISFGSALEQIWGAKKFLFFYFSCGIGAVLFSSMINYFEFHNSLNILIENGLDKQEVYQILSNGQYNTGWQEILTDNEFNGLVKTYSSRSFGASGAISGLLVAFAFMFPNLELSLFLIPIPIKAKHLVIGIFTLDLILGIQGSSLISSGFETKIGHFAHLGGALIGFIMMWYWKKNQFNKNRWDR